MSFTRCCAETWPLRAAPVGKNFFVDLRAFTLRMMPAASPEEPAAQQPLSGAGEPWCTAAGMCPAGHQKAACEGHSCLLA